MVAKWFRLNCWIRAAILYPAYAAVVFALDIVFDTRPIFPAVVVMPLVVVLPACLMRRRRQEQDPDEHTGDQVSSRHVNR